jgi:hypothetical protein
MEGMLAHLHGDLPAALSLAQRASAEGAAAGSANAEMVVDGGLLFAVLRDSGEVDLARHTYQAVIARHHEASRGLDTTPLMFVDFGADRADVRRVLDATPSDGLVDERDSIFLLVATFSGCAAAYVGDDDGAATAAARLAPYDDRFTLDGLATVCYGPVSLFLGKMAAWTGQADLARAHFEAALAAVAPLDAPLLDAEIRSRSAALGPRPATARSAHGVFVRDGDVWQVAFGARSARFADAKGLRDLAVLVARPGREVHVLDLVGSPVAPSTPDQAIDAAARRAYESRIRDLTESIEEADAANDLGAQERFADERERVLHELAAALGLGGRTRSSAPDPAERARKAVGMRIRAAIQRIDGELPDLGRHLRHAVRTGAFCVYEPEQPVEWTT